jgi:hypothetical protein
MGQQQLLLIVLGVILVGVAVVLGIQYFGVGAEEGAKDELVAHTLTVGSNAQQWYRKPLAMGGGGGTYVGFSAHFDSNLLKLKNSTNGSYEAGTETGTQIVITGTPHPNLGYAWIVTTTVFTDSMYTEIVTAGP